MNQAINTYEIENQIQSLRQQLEEAEELRLAISHGQVDAFVVGATDDSKRCSCSRARTRATASSSRRCSKARSR